MPTNIKKYAGCVRVDGRKWVVQFRDNAYRETKSFKTKEEAYAYKIEVNIRENLPYNIIFLYENQYYCVLSQRQLMKFSFRNYDIVERYTWSAMYSPGTMSFYATTNIDKKTKKFHRFVLSEPKKGESVDHINMITLDNNFHNLRNATRPAQNINRGIFKNNKTGTKGVSFNKQGSWVANWNDETGSLKSKCFSVAKFGHDNAKTYAIGYRKEIESTLAHYIEALNP